MPVNPTNYNGAGGKDASGCITDRTVSETDQVSCPFWEIECFGLFFVEHVVSFLVLIST